LASARKNIVVLGFGSIGQAIVPLLKRHFGDWAICIVEQSITEEKASRARRYDLQCVEATVCRDNYRSILEPLVQAGDFLVNLATSICSRDMVRFAHARGAYYLDTCIDPWTYAHVSQGISTSNYDLREEIRALQAETVGGPTALVGHGANPGFVSILVKQALRRMAHHNGLPRRELSSQNDWAALARELDVRVIQISERDTQRGTISRAEGEFVNTWSVDGFVTECLQPAEMGWGTHESELPADARTHEYGCRAAIAIDRPSYTVKVKAWSPNYLDFDGYLITHNEAISLADYLTYRDHGVVSYRPTCYYAYHPCDEAVESLELLRDASGAGIRSQRILRSEICSGIDELGVFVISGTYHSLWFGSELSIGKARKMADLNNATSLQVVSSAISGMFWILENPAIGLVESEEVDDAFVYEFARPYWSPIVEEFVDWRPSRDSRDLHFGTFLTA
jgi:homospermidine synthase